MLTTIIAAVLASTVNVTVSETDAFSGVSVGNWEVAELYVGVSNDDPSMGPIVEVGVESANGIVQCWPSLGECNVSAERL